jgi:hypothetical protein
MNEKPIENVDSHNFKFTKTPLPPTREEFLAEIREYYNYFSLSSAIEWTKKPWVPFWLWRLVADGKFIGEE